MDGSPVPAADLAGVLELGEMEALTSCPKCATACHGYGLCPDRAWGAEQICPLTQSSYFSNSLSFFFFLHHSFYFIGIYVTTSTTALVK